MNNIRFGFDLATNHNQISIMKHMRFDGGYHYEDKSVLDHIEKLKHILSLREFQC